MKSTFQDDQLKYYATISSELVEEKRKNKGSGITINGCLKARMISLFPNGEWQIKRYLCNCNSCVMGLFNTCERDVVEEVVKDIAKEVQDEVDYLDETDNTESEMFAFIEEDSFIGVYSSSKSLELFYILKVIEKAIAEDDIIDIYGHLIQKGAQ